MAGEEDAELVDENVGAGDTGRAVISQTVLLVQYEQQDMGYDVA